MPAARRRFRPTAPMRNWLIVTAALATAPGLAVGFPLAYGRTDATFTFYAIFFGIVGACTLIAAVLHRVLTR